ncbi:MAG: hypothetical protein ACYS1A_19475 [Planctomycetota bacterium]|jgi:hypothetical protein
MKAIGLIRFLKGYTDAAIGMPGCANLDQNGSGCIKENGKGCKVEQGKRENGKGCKVEQGKRCTYFERVVLPTAADTKYREEIYSQYTIKCNKGKPLARLESRPCPDCGAGMKYRKRYCKNCKKKRRQKTNRENQKKYYDKRRAS